MVNKLLDPLVSNINGFLTGAIVLLPLTYMVQFCTKLMFITF
jgi:hypothetical protein